MSFMSFLTNALSGGAKLAGAAVHAGDKIAGTFFDFVKKSFSTAIQVLQSGGALIFSLAHRLTAVIGDTLRIAVGAAAAVIGIGMAGALKAQLEASGVLQMAQASGRSVGSSITAAAGLRGFGVKAGDVSGLQNDVFQQQMMGGVFGVGDYGTPEGLAQYRQRYRGLQSGGYLGRTMARNMESSMGTEALRGTAMLPDDLFNKQQQRSAGIQNSLGMNPRDVEKAAQNFTLLRASIEQLGSTVLTRIGTEVLPYLIKVTDKAVDAIVANGDRIAEGIHNGVGIGIRALANFGIFLVRDLPQMLFAGARFLLRGVATIADVAPMLGRAIMRIADIAKSAVSAVWHGIKGIWSSLSTRLGSLLASFSQTTVGKFLFPNGQNNGTAPDSRSPRSPRTKNGSGDPLSNGIDFINSNPYGLRIPKPNSPVYALLRAVMPLVRVSHATNAAAGRVGKAATKAMGGDEGEQTFGYGVGYLAAGLGTRALLKAAPKLLFQGARQLAGRVLFPATEKLAFGVGNANPFVAGTKLAMGTYEGARALFPKFGESQNSLGHMLMNPAEGFVNLYGRTRAALLNDDMYAYDNDLRGDNAEAQSRAILAGRHSHTAAHRAQQHGKKRTARGLVGDARHWLANSELGDIGSDVFQRGKAAWNGEYSHEPNQIRDAALQAIQKLDKMEGAYKSDAAVKFLEEIKNMTGESLRKSTQIERNTAKTADGLGDFGQGLIAQTLNYRTELDAGALRRF